MLRSIKTTLFWALTFGCTVSIFSVWAAEDEQKYTLPEAMKTDTDFTIATTTALMSSPEFAKQMSTLAAKIDLDAEDNEFRLDEELTLRSFYGQHKKVLEIVNEQAIPSSHFHHLAYSSTMLKNKSIAQLPTEVNRLMTQLDDEALYRAGFNLSWQLSIGIDYFNYLLNGYKKNGELTRNQALNLLYNYHGYKIYEAVLPSAKKAQTVAHNARFDIDTDVIITMPDGAEVSAVVVRKKGDVEKRPTAFQFTIYANEQNHVTQAIHAVVHGYNAVIANTRGKRLSKGEIIPWEKDGADAHQVIDWITKQPWSDGRVGMYGGSYVGFTQWAAAKYMHPALKTIVPYAAANPLTGLPIENNVFITANYQWSFYVTNNKTLDESVYADHSHWQNVYKTLYTSGRAFRDIDKIEGTPNPWFHKFLDNPDYSKYYQDMMPYKDDYKRINIPVLSVTGYFDGGQISALDFMTQHYKYNPNADHYLLIGPYNHGTAQGVPYRFHGNVRLDDAAMEKDTEEITFAWFDHVFYGKDKPALIKDKVNYQTMGTNAWQHAPSYQSLEQSAKAFYLTTQKDEQGHFVLSQTPPKDPQPVALTVDMADRKEQRNLKPWPIIQDSLPASKGLTFVSAPLTQTMAFAGAINGELCIAVNKKDVDLGFNFYEITAEGKAVNLAHYFSRASYAKDMGKRQLLTPKQKSCLPIVNPRMNAKLLNKGSRLAIVLDVNKHEGAQVNMGTGRDVSGETIADAGEPLTIEFYTDSTLKMPITPWAAP